MSTDVTSFAGTADRFCRLIEHRETGNSVELLRQLQILLPELYRAALRLPDTTPCGPDADVHDKGAEKGTGTWRRILGSLGRLLGARGRYIEMFDPYELAEKSPVAPSLADDFADIYGDLQRGLRLWRAGYKDDAVWEWRFHFEHHWGFHLTDALRAMHWLAYTHEWKAPRRTRMLSNKRLKRAAKKRGRSAASR